MTARWVDHFGTGIHSARPAASAVPKGAMYACSTHGLIYQSDGATTWATWATLGGSGGLTDPTTTKGDLIVRGASAPGRHGVGADGTVLTADSAQADGMAWAAPAGGSAFTKQVDLPLTTLTGWTAGAGTWSASGAGIADTLTGNPHRLFYNTLLDQAEMVVQAEIRIDSMSAGGHAGFLFGAPATDASSGLEVSLLGTTTQVTSAYAEVDNVAGVGTVALGAAINHGSFITLKLHKSGTVVTVWVNGTQVTSFFASGSVNADHRRLGFKSANAQVTIRNLLVYTPTLPI